MTCGEGPIKTGGICAPFYLIHLEIGFCYVALVDLELTKITLPVLLNSRIHGMSHDNLNFSF